MNSLELTHDNLQIVVIENPYFTLREDGLARELFGKVLGVRLTAYLENYGEGVFPLGKEDFLSDLVIICIREGENLTPVYSFKISSLETCDRFQLPFPILYMLKERYGENDIYQHLEEYVAKFREAGKNLSYFGSRSKSREVIWTENSGKLLNLVGVSMLINATRYFKIDEFVLFAMMNNDAYKYCEKLGMHRLLENRVIVNSLRDAESFVMSTSTFSEEALWTERKFSKYWENRIHLGQDKAQLKRAG